jgi:Predicted esterase of the alpha-beta hydrolase superfamily
MTDETKKKDVALVLSSGGARGLAHIGAIEELEARGYHISSIAGCSMGALIGGVYAAGKLEEFREWMKTVDKKKDAGIDGLFFVAEPSRERQKDYRGNHGVCS